MGDRCIYREREQMKEREEERERKRERERERERERQCDGQQVWRDNGAQLHPKCDGIAVVDCRG